MHCPTYLRETATRLVHSLTSYFHSINWAEEARLWSTAAVLTAVIFLSITYIPFFATPEGEWSALLQKIPGFWSVDFLIDRVFDGGFRYRHSYDEKRDIEGQKAYAPRRTIVCGPTRSFDGDSEGEGEGKGEEDESEDEDVEDEDRDKTAKGNGEEIRDEKVCEK